MKKIASFALCAMLLFSVFALFGCMGESLEEKMLMVEISHTSGFITEEPYYKYFEIEKSKTWELPNGKSIPYELEFTISEINSEEVDILLSRTMLLYDEIEKKWNEVTRVTLKIGENIKISTPTDGGCDSYVFSIID